MCQGLAPLDGGDPDVLALGVLAGSPEYEVYDGLVESVAWGGQVLKGFDGELGPPLFWAVPAEGSAQGPAMEGCSAFPFHFSFPLPCGLWYLSLANLLTKAHSWYQWSQGNPEFLQV